MPARRVRSGAIWAGAGLSGLAHAGLIALALAAPPWLRAHRERPLPVVAVALVTPAALEAALAARPPAPAPAAAPAPAPLDAPGRPPPAASVAEPPPGEPPEEPPALPSLAPAFDPESPLGLGDPRPPADLPAHRPHARSGPPPPVAPAPVDRAEAAAAFEAAVRAAVAGRLGPVAPDAAGTVRLVLVVNREGRLLAARLAAPSGSEELDRAAVEAARTALLPQMPDAMPNVRATVEVDLVFAPAAAGRGG
jgi:TonB family protein